MVDVFIQLFIVVYATLVSKVVIVVVSVFIVDVEVLEVVVVVVDDEFYFKPFHSPKFS